MSTLKLCLALRNLNSDLKMYILLHTRARAHTNTEEADVKIETLYLGQCFLLFCIVVFLFPPPFFVKH